MSRLRMMVDVHHRRLVSDQVWSWRMLIVTGIRRRQTSMAELPVMSRRGCHEATAGQPGVTRKALDTVNTTELAISLG